MAVEGFDLRSLPLVKRKGLLRKVLPEAGPLRYSEHFEKDGEALYDRAVGMGLEGIVAKKADAPYKSGRSDLRSEEHTSELQSPCNLVCRLLLEKKKTQAIYHSKTPTVPQALS